MKNKRLWTLISLFLILLLMSKFILRFSKTINFEEEELYSKAVYVYNLTNKKEVFGINENEPRAMASLTKLMTGLVGLDYVTDFTVIAPMSTENYQELVAKNYSITSFAPGELTNYDDIFHGIILPSGADAVYSLIDNLGFSEEEFIQLMNDKVESLELENTHYQNMVGFDQENHYSCAKDVAKILESGLENSKFRELITKETYTSHPTKTHPEGILLKSTVLANITPEMEKGFHILGGKSGTTGNAGLCWATLGEVYGEEYIVVVMGAPWKNGPVEDGHLRDTIKIYKKLADLK